MEGAKKSRFVKAGDLILTNSMSYGRPYIMNTDGYIHDGWFVLRLGAELDTEYMFYLLSSPYVQNQFKSLAAGSVVKNISSDLTKRAKIPIPPIEVQRQIADVISVLEEQAGVYIGLEQKILNSLFSVKSAILAQELKGPES